MKKRRPSTKIAVMSIAFLAAVIISFGLGRFDVPLAQLFRILAAQIGLPVNATWTDAMQTVVVNIRLPRIIAACLVGACLSVAGMSFQGVFQNPIASPDLLGASSGAAFGAALAILLGANGTVTAVSAFLFGLASVGLVMLVGKRSPGRRTISLILAGMMVSSLFSAATSFLKLVADPSNQLMAITYWLMGSLSNSDMGDILFVLPPMIVGLVPLMLLRWRMNLLALNDDEARSMGVQLDKLRVVVILSSTLITAASVCISGMIGWVGLVIPHFCRGYIGNDYRTLFPATMLTGATFMLVIDDVSRNLLVTEIPIGILTAFIGAPLFLYLVARKEQAL